MLNSKMKRSMAWIMTVAVMMTAVPVSAADFVQEADVEAPTEAAEVEEENTLSEANTGEDSYDSADIAIDDENDLDTENISIEDNTEDSDDVENVFSDGEEATISSIDAEEFADNSNTTVDELAEAFSVGTSNNDDPYSSIDRLENGTYTVTANVYVPGELNKVWLALMHFLRIPNIHLDLVLTKESLQQRCIIMLSLT
mgnify:CR=1 FL=1